MTTRVPFLLTLWTGDAALARAADRAGVDRIGPDLETLGKAQRQAGQGTWLSPHRVQQLGPVRAALQKANLFARTNPIHPGSRDELQLLIDQGVEVLMLPNFSSVGEVERYLELVDGRAKVVPLLERTAVLPQLDRLLALPGIAEIHIGLTDLSLDLGVANRTAFLTSDVVRDIAAAVTSTGLRLGVGGIARARDEYLPVRADLVYAQYPRLRATAALISRSFAPERLAPDELQTEIARARDRINEWFAAPRLQLDSAFAELRSRCDAPNAPAA